MCVHSWQVWKWIASNIYLQAEKETKLHIGFNFQLFFSILKKTILIFGICVVYSKNSSATLLSVIIGD